MAKRTEGMQFKTQKFHGVVHLADDILNFGVPLEVDTGSNESGHKVTKVAAKLTQRNEETFDEQTSIRLEEVHLLDMAKAELEGKFIGDYLDKTRNPPAQNTEKEETTVGGSEYHFFFDNERQKYCACTTKKMDKKHEIAIEKDLIDFMGGLNLAVSHHVSSVTMQTLHRRKGQIFRADNNYRDTVWRDWALIDWGNEGKLPNKLWGFVDLSALPDSCRVTYGGVRLYSGNFAIVENASFLEDEMEVELSEIFVPIEKHLAVSTENTSARLQLYLADVEAIVEPIAVVPDIGGPSNRYFYVKDREEWRKDFEEFLEKPLDIEAEISDDEASVSSSEDE